MTGVLLAEYFTTDDKTFMFMMRSEYDKPTVLTIGISADEALRFAQESFAGGRSARSVELDAWQERFGALVAPLVGHCAEGDVVWFVPHGPLHYLPLHALQVDGRYLIERNPVCYAPSAAVMKYCRAKRTGRRRRALIVGDSRGDLPYAHEEAVMLAELFGGEPHLGTTKGEVRALLEQAHDADVLHVACHGYFDTGDALRSGILLALAPEDVDDTDAILSAKELLNIKLRADLVTLSACESGISEHRPGDELIGLTRALIYAGTPSVVVSLWRVDDLSTGLLMRGFYERLLRPSDTPVSKAQALQAAALDIMERTAEQMVAECTERLTRIADHDTSRRLLLELEASAAHAAAGDLEQALRVCDAAAGQDTPLAARAARTASVLRFKLAARGRRSEPAEIDYTTRPFQHPAHWAPFILVGDWT